MRPRLTPAAPPTANTCGFRPFSEPDRVELLLPLQAPQTGNRPMARTATGSGAIADFHHEKLRTRARWTRRLLGAHSRPGDPGPGRRAARMVGGVGQARGVGGRLHRRDPAERPDVQPRDPGRVARRGAGAIATDGFTIWGAPIAGYYPSKVNCWSPALSRSAQISTPVCAASTTFAGWRQLFLPAKGLRRSAARDLTALGNCRWLVARQ